MNGKLGTPWKRPSRRQGGFTLTEILIVVSILLLILMLILVNMQSQIMKARDSQRKTDLHNIQKAYEEYFNDKQCYPFEQILERCRENDLAPYLKRIPCDPTTKLPYLYVPGSPSLCSGYRVCAKLEYTKDPDITRIGCDPVAGCGWAVGYNYCLSVGYEPALNGGNSGTAGSFSVPGGGSPTPTPVFGGNYACRRGGACNDVGVDPRTLGCPSSFSQPDCSGLCTNPWYWCAQ